MKEITLEDIRSCGLPHPASLEEHRENMERFWESLYPDTEEEDDDLDD